MSPLPPPVERALEGRSLLPAGLDAAPGPFRTPITGGGRAGVHPGATRAWLAGWLPGGVPAEGSVPAAPETLPAAAPAARTPFLG